jgi:hypothetical protein
MRFAIQFLSGSKNFDHAFVGRLFSNHIWIDATNFTFHDDPTPVLKFEHEVRFWSGLASGAATGC